MIKHLILPALLLATTTSAFAFTDEEINTALIGSWGSRESCTGVTLVFNDDGTFVRTSAAGSKSYGTYEIKDGKLIGMMKSGNELPVVTVGYDGTTLSFLDEGHPPIQLYACPAK